MVEAARLDGVLLDISSTYRSYTYQENLFAYWVDQLGREEAERVSARAGTSQHQLGTTVDFGSVTTAFAAEPGGIWLSEHAHRFGFSLSYPDGYEAVNRVRLGAMALPMALPPRAADGAGVFLRYSAAFPGVLAGSGDSPPERLHHLLLTSYRTGMSTSPAATIGLAFPDILLPASSVDMERWAVIACDQYTADRGYWDDVSDFVGDSPSTLNLIVPEVYLGDGDMETRLAGINTAMARYLTDGTLRTVERSAIFVRRTLRDGTVRRGIVIAVDLEAYDYSPESTSAIRASEETIPARLPARVDVRREALLESPHVLVLFDDPENNVTTHLEEHLSSLEQLYVTPLMKSGGEVTGYRIPEDSPAAAGSRGGPRRPWIRRSASASASPPETATTVWAAARKLWAELREGGASMDDPRRWCLVELVNVYDEGLPFHPIHRLVTGDEQAVLDALLTRGGGVTPDFTGFPSIVSPDTSPTRVCCPGKSHLSGRTRRVS
jgi:hypothetical protein